jgi:hypothetical protein
MGGKLTILVSGMIAGTPGQGGAAWAVLQYLLGLRQLGHDVYFLEPVEQAAIRPCNSTLEDSTNAVYLRGVARDFDLEGKMALLRSGSRETTGLAHDELTRVAGRADVLINISGRLRIDELAGSIAVRVYLDLDPAFTQLWSSVEGIAVGFAGHTHFVTIGQAIGRSGCSVPTCDLPWITTLQPIALPFWPPDPPNPGGAITTVANWRSYGSIRHNGILYGQKCHSLRPLMGLPGVARDRFDLALRIHPDERADLDALRAHGWNLIDPDAVTYAPRDFQRFVRASKAELGIAKSGYLAAACGWFSDRSICYLASGRPVIAQETGFSEYLPTDAGLLRFESLEDAAQRVEELNRDYARHAHRAREIAEEYFAADRVLTRLLQRIGVAP